MSPRTRMSAKHGQEMEEVADTTSRGSLALEIEMLTFQFQEQTFTQYWKSLQRLGCSYEASHGTYRFVNLLPPSEHGGGSYHHDSDSKSGIISSSSTQLRFSSAAEVLLFLDQSSLRPVHSNLQSTSLAWPQRSSRIGSCEPGSLGSIQYSASEKNLARYLRRCLLEEMMNNQPFGENHVDDPNGTGKVASTAATTTTTTSESRQLRSRQSLQPTTATTATGVTRSATASEKGTAMYLNRKSRKKRKSTKRDTELPVSAYSQQSMTLEHCIDFAESLIQEEDEDDHDEIHVLSIPEQEFTKEFSEWRFLLSTNHSLLFFGSGSKSSLLTQFAQCELPKEGHVLSINGHQDSATMDGILSLLVQLFLGDNEPTDHRAVPTDDDEGVPLLGRSTRHRNHPLVERAIRIGRAIAHSIDRIDREGDTRMDEEEAIGSVLPIFLVIHNLDAPNFANAVVQDALAALLVNSNVSNHVASIRLVASVDHIDAPMHLWGNTATAANFSWINKAMHTHRPYTQELRLLSEDEQKRRKSRGIAETMETVRASRVIEVLRNLAPRHAEVVSILAKLQLDQRKKSAWVSYQTYLTHCQRACAIQRDSQLRGVLKELSDHGLVVCNLQSSSEYVQIPYDETKLNEILTHNLKG